MHCLALGLRDSTLGRLCFSVYSCNILTPSWLPSDQLFHILLLRHCIIIISKWTTLPTLVNKLALLLNLTTISNENTMRVRSQQSASSPWILHVCLPTAPQHLRYLCFIVVVHLRSSTFEACFLPSSLLSIQHVIPRSNTRIDNLLESSSHNCAKPVMN